MTTLLISHNACLDHEPGDFHPEHPNRLRAIQRVLEMEAFSLLERAEAPRATHDQLLRAHPGFHIESILSKLGPDKCRELHPDERCLALDDDTFMSCGSGEAALRSAGAAVMAVDEIMSPKRRHHNVFVATRPPGHHAEPDKAMGFCLFNNVGVAALHARQHWGVERVAIVDFDVHHGNGTQKICWDDPGLFYASTHEANIFPYTGKADETGVSGNILNCPLPAYADGGVFQQVFAQKVIAALEAFNPQLILASTGFDAHVMDPMSSLGFKVSDFTWATRELMNVAQRLCNRRLISVLEGGYDITSLSSCVVAHLKSLMED